MAMRCNERVRVAKARLDRPWYLETEKRRCIYDRLGMSWPGLDSRLGVLARDFGGIDSGHLVMEALKLRLEAKICAEQANPT